MKKTKYIIIFLILFMIIGYATISVTLSIGGNANILSNIDDFKVYFSDVLVDGKQDLRLVKNEKELYFSMDFLDIGAQHTITYDVTNASGVFDASLSINCTQGNEYLSVVNVFDTSTNLVAKSTRTGTLTLKKLKSNASENATVHTVTCTIVASPIEKDNNTTGEIISPLQPIQLATGDVIGIDGEYFNIISQTDTTVTMLAQYNLGTDYRQSTTPNYVSFSNTDGWRYASYQQYEIDIQQFDGNAKTYVNEYVAYLKEVTGDTTIKGNLISFSDFKNLGCDVGSDEFRGCRESPNVSWLATELNWWTCLTAKGWASGVTIYPENVINPSGSTASTVYNNDEGVVIRPVITIPIELARLYSLKKYDIGEEISIGSEKFNVIKDNGATVTMLAQYNLGTDYRQSTTTNYFKFSNSYGWEYTPGPQEIDIQAFDGNAKTYVNEYVSYLKGETGDSSLTGTLITMTELKNLGCTGINDDYSLSDGCTCINSKHKSWLDNGQVWWTRSAFPGTSGYVWAVNVGSLLSYQYNSFIGVRPVITISKSAL